MRIGGVLVGADAIPGTASRRVSDDAGRIASAELLPASLKDAIDLGTIVLLVSPLPGGEPARP
ncbi:MAG TPA: hypothetical protein VKU01_12710 [Bryobacteraceae bacterium]|nr:hypothetical protein [Bryobacteraceae bacterium]